MASFRKQQFAIYKEHLKSKWVTRGYLFKVVERHLPSLWRGINAPTWRRTAHNELPSKWVPRDEHVITSVDAALPSLWKAQDTLYYVELLDPKPRQGLVSRFSRGGSEFTYVCGPQPESECHPMDPEVHKARSVNGKVLVWTESSAGRVDIPRRKWTDTLPFIERYGTDVPQPLSNYSEEFMTRLSELSRHATMITRALKGSRNSKVVLNAPRIGSHVRVRFNRGDWDYGLSMLSPDLEGDLGFDYVWRIYLVDRDGGKCSFGYIEVYIQLLKRRQEYPPIPPSFGSGFNVLFGDFVNGWINAGG